MQDHKFYGTEDISSISFLEFGAIDMRASKKLVWDLKLHQKAYDWYMHARYSNDIVCYMAMSEQLNAMQLTELIAMYREEIHHKDDFSMNLGKLCALAAVRDTQSRNQPLTFFELGQTLFGCIDGMDFCQLLMAHLKVDSKPVNLNEVHWYGVDISNFFNKLAVLMHPRQRVRACDDLKELPGIMDVFFAKGVTMLYAIRNIDQLVNILNSARTCIFDYSFAADKEHEVIIGSGKTVKYIRMADFLLKLKELPGSFYVKRGNSFHDKQSDRVVVDCLYSDEQTCREFMALDGSVRAALRGALRGLEGADVILDDVHGRNSGWMLLEEFVRTHVGFGGADPSVNAAHRQP